MADSESNGMVSFSSVAEVGVVLSFGVVDDDWASVDDCVWFWVPEKSNGLCDFHAIGIYRVSHKIP